MDLRKRKATVIFVQEVNEGTCGHDEFVAFINQTVIKWENIFLCSRSIRYVVPAQDDSKILDSTWNKYNFLVKRECVRHWLVNCPKMQRYRKSTIKTNFIKFYLKPWLHLSYTEISIKLFCLNCSVLNEISGLSFRLWVFFIPFGISYSSASSSTKFRSFKFKFKNS